jgi:hypothetical protein
VEEAEEDIPLVATLLGAFMDVTMQFINNLYISISSRKEKFSTLN